MEAKKAIKRSALVTIMGAVPAALCWWALPFMVPLPPKLLEPLPASPIYLAADGSPLRQLLSEEGQRTSAPVSYSQIPQAIIHATLAAEDKRFYSHGGIDLLAVVRAVRDNMMAQRVISGASTITQQLIKNSTDKKAARTLLIKIKESLQARRLEMTWSKDQILTEYLNRVSYGNLHTGCYSASQGYFNKPLQDLTHAEAALLASLPQSPARLNPHKNFKAVQKRQRLILDLMLKNEWLDETSKQLAYNEKLLLKSYTGGFSAPHAVAMSTTKDAIIKTTIVRSIQSRAEQIIDRKLSLLADKHVTQAAVVVIDNKTGNILALVGSRDFFDDTDGQINGAWSPHSPGSALKPFTYLLALNHGLTAASIISDLPIEYATATGLYRPENYDHRHYGPVTLRHALGNSLNIPAVRTLQEMGGEIILYDALKSLGVTTLDHPAEHYGLGLTIGNAPIRLVELTNAYACLARLGEQRPWTLVEIAPSVTTRLFPSNTAYVISDILNDNQARLTTFGPRSIIKMPFPCAVKTGTSTNYRDNWTLGYTPEFTVGVWVGNFDNTPMNEVSGVSGAGPIFRDIFIHLNETYGTTWYDEPPTLVHAKIDPRNGRAVTSLSPTTRMSQNEIFVAGTIPPSATTADYEAETGNAYISQHYKDWLKLGSPTMSGFFALRENAPNLNSPRIISPVNRTVYYLDPDLKENGNKLMLTATEEDTVKWTSPTLEIISIGTQFYAKLTPGKHEILATNVASHDEARSIIEVRKPLSLMEMHSRFASTEPDTPVRQKPENKQENP